jgi:hypothetical protein
MSGTEKSKSNAQDQGDAQVSEVNRMQGEPEEILPEDAVAGAPPAESGKTQEGTAGPDAPPRDGRPDVEGRSGDD